MIDPWRHSVTNVDWGLASDAVVGAGADHCRPGPQVLPVELGTDMQYGQSMSALPSESEDSKTPHRITRAPERRSHASALVFGSSSRFDQHLGTFQHFQLA